MNVVTGGVMTTFQELTDLLLNLADNSQGFMIALTGEIIVHIPDDTSHEQVKSLRNLLGDRVYGWEFDRNCGELRASFQVVVRE